jgi:hypothetical protein
VRFSHFKSTSLKMYKGAYWDAYKNFLSVCEIRGISKPSCKDSQLFWDFCKLHFPMPKCVALGINLGFIEATKESAMIEDNKLINSTSLKEMKKLAVSN